MKIIEVLNITAACLRESPNTFLLIMTLIPAYKIQNKLSKILDSKYKSETNKNKSVLFFVYKKKYVFLAIYWVLIMIFIILLHPSELRILNNYFPSYVNLNNDGYKLIKIGFSIFATVLAIILNWYESKLLKWSSFFLITGLTWSIMLALDILYCPGYLQSVSVYLLKSLAICSIFKAIMDLKMLLPAIDQHNVASVLPESNKGVEMKISETRKLEEINTELAKRNRMRLIKQEQVNNEGLMDRHKKKVKWEYPVGSSPLSKDDLKYDDLDSEQKKIANKLGNKEKPKYEESKSIDKTLKRTASGAEVTIPGETEIKNRQRKKWVNKPIANIKRLKEGRIRIPLDISKMEESSEKLNKRIKDPTSGSQKILENAKIDAFNFYTSKNNDEIDREAVLEQIKIDLKDPISKCLNMLDAGRRMGVSRSEREKILRGIDILKNPGGHTGQEIEDAREKISRLARKGYIHTSRVKESDNPVNNLNLKKKRNSIFYFSTMGIKLDGEVLNGLCECFHNYINYFLFFSILLSCYIIYSKMDTFVSIRFGSYSDEEKYKVGSILKWFIIVFTVIIVFFFWPWNTLLIDNWFNGISNTIIYRSLKLTLGLFLGFLVIYINLNTLGLYSWKTFYSFISIIIIIFIILISFNHTFYLYVNNFIGLYIVTYIIMIINGCFSNLFLYFECPIDESNIKQIIPKKRLPLENEVLILETNTNGKKRELDVEDIEMNDSVASSPVKNDRMDIDREYDNLINNRVPVDNTGVIDEQPKKKQKGEEENSINNKYSEQQYMCDISILEERDLDFESIYIDKNTGLSNSIILNDISIRQRIKYQLTGGIESLQQQAALRNNNIVRGQLKLIPGNWWHTKVNLFRKLSLPEQEKLINQFKDMLSYNNTCIDNGVELYNKLRPAGSSLTRSEIELKVEAWDRIVTADPSKMTAIQQNLEDFVEFAPNTADNIKIKNIIVKQIKGYNSPHSILRQWEKKIIENSSIEEGVPIKTWVRSESKVLREIYLRRKLNGECSIVEHIDRRAERIDADRNNEWWVQREKEHEQKLKNKFNKEKSEVKKKIEANLIAKGVESRWF